MTTKERSKAKKGGRNLKRHLARQIRRNLQNVGLRWERGDGTARWLPFAPKPGLCFAEVVGKHPNFTQKSYIYLFPDRIEALWEDDTCDHCTIIRSGGVMYKVFGSYDMIIDVLESGYDSRSEKDWFV